MPETEEAKGPQEKLTTAILALADVAAIYPPHGAIRAEAERIWQMLGTQEEPKVPAAEGYVHVGDKQVTARIAIASSAAAPEVVQKVAALIREHVPGLKVSVTAVRIQDV